MRKNNSKWEASQDNPRAVARAIASVFGPMPRQEGSERRRWRIEAENWLLPAERPVTRGRRRK